MTEKIKRAVRVKDWTTEIPDLENRFAGLPIAVAYIDGVNWRFLKHISYRTKANEISTIRKGFVLDFASVPQNSGGCILQRDFLTPSPLAGMTGCIATGKLAGAR